MGVKTGGIEVEGHLLAGMIVGIERKEIAGGVFGVGKIVAIIGGVLVKEMVVERGG